VKVLPGVRLNVSKRGAGVSVGPRGAKLSVNTRGQVRKTAGIPGTGLSYTTQSKLSAGVKPEDLPPGELAQVAAVATPEELRRVKRRMLRRLIGWGSAALFVILIFAGAASAAGTILIPAIAATLLVPLIVYR
jgi:hypothetical protein